jgi:branched-chain amino acid transport system permease protein
MAAAEMTFFDKFWQLTVDGLSTGSLYAVIALGYTLVYGVLQLINFAHSEVFMFGGFAGVFAVRGIAPNGSTGWLSVGLIVFGLLCGAAAGGLSAFVLERTAYAPLRRRGAPKLAYLISAIGASYFAFNLAGKEFGRQNVNAPNLYKDSTVLFHIFSAKVQINTLLIFGVAIAMLISLDRLVNGTRLGKAIRAVAQDSDTASLMGIDVNRIIIFTFVIGGLLAGAGGYLYAQVFSASYTMGFLPGIKAFTAAVLGGIGNVRGAMVGGLVLGVVESYGGDLLGGSYVDVVAFLVLVMVLLFRPSGILGERLGRAA